MERWSGKVAIVTGASSGIGEAIAESLVKHGMKVVGLARREDRLQSVKNRLKGEKGTFFPVKCDLLVEEDILSAFAWTEKNLGGVNVLVNNAGTGKLKNVEELSTDDLRKVFNLNVVALQISCREALKSMRGHSINDGHIINISSAIVQKDSPFPGMTTYYASKKAVNAIGDGLRIELAAEKSDIRVTTICPGLVETDLVQESGLPVPREVLDIALQPSDVADVTISVLQLPRRALVPDIFVTTVRDITETFKDLIKEKQN